MRQSDRWKDGDITACTAVISHTVFRCCCLFIPGTYTGEGVKLWMFLIIHLCVYNHPTWHIWKSYQTQISHSFDFIKQYEELKSLWQMVPSLSGQMWDCSQRCSTHLDRSVRIALQHEALFVFTLACYWQWATFELFSPHWCVSLTSQTERAESQTHECSFILFTKEIWSQYFSRITTVWRWQKL